MRLEGCDGATTAGARVVTVNDSSISPIALDMDRARLEGDCEVADGTVDLKRLGKHFARGINRFEVEAGGRRVEILLDIEL